MSDKREFLRDHEAEVIKTEGVGNVHTLIVLLDDRALDQIRQIVREEMDRGKYEPPTDAYRQQKI